MQGVCAARFPRPSGPPPFSQALEGQALPGFLRSPRQNGILGLACLLSGMVLSRCPYQRGGRFLPLYLIRTRVAGKMLDGSFAHGRVWPQAQVPVKTELPGTVRFWVKQKSVRG